MGNVHPWEIADQISLNNCVHSRCYIYYLNKNGFPQNLMPKNTEVVYKIKQCYTLYLVHS